MSGMSQQGQTMNEDTTVSNQITASNADAAAPHEQSPAANDDSSKADAPILNNLDEIPAANDADAAPKADTEKPKKSWTRFFGGLAYDEVKNAIGWLGTYQLFLQPGMCLVKLPYQSPLLLYKLSIQP